jgi:hypothetical protein
MLRAKRRRAQIVALEAGPGGCSGRFPGTPPTDISYCVIQLHRSYYLIRSRHEKRPHGRSLERSVESVLDQMLDSLPRHQAILEPLLEIGKAREPPG